MKQRARKFSLVAPTPVAFACPRSYGECENARECIYPGRCRHAEKLAAALAYLGTKWSHHPQFVGKKNLANGLLNKWRANRMVGRGVTVTSKERDGR